MFSPFSACARFACYVNTHTVCNLNIYLENFQSKTCNNTVGCLHSRVLVFGFTKPSLRLVISFRMFVECETDSELDFGRKSSTQPATIWHLSHAHMKCLPFIWENIVWRRWATVYARVYLIHFQLKLIFARIVSNDFDGDGSQALSAVLCQNIMQSFWMYLHNHYGNSCALVVT